MYCCEVGRPVIAEPCLALVTGMLCPLLRSRLACICSEGGLPVNGIAHWQMGRAGWRSPVIVEDNHADADVVAMVSRLGARDVEQPVDAPASALVGIPVEMPGHGKGGNVRRHAGCWGCSDVVVLVRMEINGGTCIDGKAWADAAYGWWGWGAPAIPLECQREQMACGRLLVAAVGVEVLAGSLNGFHARHHVPETIGCEDDKPVQAHKKARRCDEHHGRSSCKGTAAATRHLHRNGERHSDAGHPPKFSSSAHTCRSCAC